jgi:hypothetical protein
MPLRCHTCLYQKSVIYVECDIYVWPTNLYRRNRRHSQTVGIIDIYRPLLAL